MLKSDFNFDLPLDLIAKFPASERTHSRLLELNGEDGSLKEGHFYDVLDLINPGDLLVFNNTKVIPARLYGKKESGGAIELLVERVLNFNTAIVPYIDREDNKADRERYQTVYAKNPGAVAAPTAGLHFDNELLAKLKAKGVNTAFVTLHVGAGTFQPVKVDDISKHHMHTEYAVVPEDVVNKILETRKNGKRVIAVGTTSVRSLESAAMAAEKNGKIIDTFASDTSIFIYPGYKYHVIDALITNFHLPESTLIMLVSAFAGYKHTMNAYKYAVENKFRFFSYGDAMFITKNSHPETDKDLENICEHKE